MQIFVLFLWSICLSVFFVSLIEVSTFMAVISIFLLILAIAVSFAYVTDDNL